MRLPRRVVGWPALLVVSILVVVSTGVAACSSDRASGGSPWPPSTLEAGPAVVAPVDPATSVVSDTSMVTASTPATRAAETVSTTAPGAASTKGPAKPEGVSTTSRGPVTITVLYDNKTVLPGARGDWGFACLIEGLEDTVLFDTGEDGAILLHNLQALGVDPEEVDLIILSHDHSDHTGGLATFLGLNDRVRVCYPASFPEEFDDSIRSAGASPEVVDGPMTPCAGLLVTAPAGSPDESALAVETRKGYVVITGCAHPGLQGMVADVSDLISGPVFEVMGGFHLFSSSVEEVDELVQGLKRLGVRQCGPAHCTGEAATARIAAAFPVGFIEMGVGAVITF